MSEMKIRDRMQGINWEPVDIEKKNRGFYGCKALFLRDDAREIIILCKDVPNGGIEDGDVIIRHNPMNTSKDRLIVVDHGFTRGVGNMSEVLRDIAHDHYRIRWKKENTAELPQPTVHNNMPLTGPQFQQLQQALLSAFPSR